MPVRVSSIQEVTARTCHHHAVLAHPHKVADFVDMQLERVRVPTLPIEATSAPSQRRVLGEARDAQHVHRFGDRSDRLVPRVLVLHPDELVRPIKRPGTQERRRYLLVRIHDEEEAVGERRVRRVEVDRRDLVPAGGPLDAVVMLDVEFLRDTASAHAAAGTILTDRSERSSASSGAVKRRPER